MINEITHIKYFTSMGNNWPICKTHDTKTRTIENWSTAFFLIWNWDDFFLPPFFFFQILRALRLVIDTGLHYKGMKRDEALKMFADYAWDESDFARKEVTKMNLVILINNNNTLFQNNKRWYYKRSY